METLETHQDETPSSTGPLVLPFAGVSETGQEVEYTQDIFTMLRSNFTKGPHYHSYLFASPKALWDFVLSPENGVDRWYHSAGACSLRFTSFRSLTIAPAQLQRNTGRFDLGNSTFLLWLIPTQDVPANVEGMLGGLGFLHAMDAAGSRRLLVELGFPSLGEPLEERVTAVTSAVQSPASSRRRLRGLDCGAGVGRVSLHVLYHHMHEVDLVEASDVFLTTAETSISKALPFYAGQSVGRFYARGLQHFCPVEHYDVVWLQWVIGYLTDDHLVTFLQRCKAVLREGGRVVLKDNTAAHTGFLLDPTDGSISRSVEYITALVRRAGFSVKICRREEYFPETILPVWVFVLE